MRNNKLFILLPDGVGLRNFAFTNFHKTAKARGLDIVFWNNTPFDLTALDFKEIKISNAKAHPLTNMLKVAQTRIELALSIKRSKDLVYNSYKFPFSNEDWKRIIKNLYTNALILRYNSDKGLAKIRTKIAQHERKTKLYFDSLETLQKENPAMVFCTNQRTMLAVAPILAAQDLGIPTAAVIYSWDNLPKATKIVEPDFYFVWSEYMKKELVYYYPHVKEEQIIVTGTPQFEPHFDADFLSSKEDFYKEYNLDFNKKYICFSGDDIVSSPHDPVYLNDTATAVRNLNQNGQNLGIIFRCCPVDFSNRFDEVIEKNKDVITPIAPKWTQIAEQWNTILPTKEDLILQMNTIANTELVLNLGSSMVFDYVAFGKPCAYFNYNVENELYQDWSAEKVYNFMHFRSMPNPKAVFWINGSEEISGLILKMLGDSKKEAIENAQLWFEKINLHPAKDASKRIVDSIENIMNESQSTKND
ncbi:UDP-glycosyltransferase [Flavobacterium sp.]|uniref:UDP-glycosyltransferase n=1 Tax=Flavobacterium sp. TaxID=239 RepID=UPI00261C1EC0|nr:UDP-glycosyltransferase [Flavobacterium sp.]